eukprot:NODE_12649_length_379_cov_1.506061_g11500_i0.p1 GENE.NODE_12649_length_379_cov_1.506061_g11500_i0~~NODE_12649_length_379_cov_1.506061_g11500_i0.p1  ORF type:complete len:80 (-),score=3.99 NODE_12649_length_379_cov_1.506061_g11500_i0:139-378(-)
MAEDPRDPGLEVSPELHSGSMLPKLRPVAPPTSTLRIREECRISESVTGFTLKLLNVGPPEVNRLARMVLPGRKLAETC